jgi:hypothetical protein
VRRGEERRGEDSREELVGEIGLVLVRHVGSGDKRR